jgi:DNA-binding GntR family transcriptional regulator
MSELRRLGDEHQTLRVLACDQIREWIVTGRLAPGQRLIEGGLAAQLGVSRIPVREALKQLDAEGFVRITPRRGAVVAQLSESDAEEVYEVRAALESFAARLAAERRTPADIEVIERILAAGRQALQRRNWADVTRLNNEFHDAVAAATRNAHLAALVASYGVRMAWIFSSSARQRGVPAWDEHAQITAAIVEGDRDLAEALTARHIQQSRGAFAATRKEAAHAHHRQSELGG